MLTFQATPSLVRSLAISPDDRFLTASSLLWDLTEPMELTVELKPGCIAREMGFLDDSRLAVVSSQGAILLADPTKPSAFTTHCTIDPAPEAASILPENQFRFWFTERVEVWQLQSKGAERLTTVPVPAGASAITYSPDGSRFAIAVVGRTVGELGPTFRQPFTIQICDGTGRLVAELRKGSGSLQTLKWSLCGRFLVVGIGLRLYVWDAENGTQIAELRAGGTGLFSGPQFHPSGRFLAAGGANIDGGVYCWDTTTWEEIVAYRWPVGPVIDVTFSRDGLLAAAGGERGQVTVWDVDL